jgi:hypothetical protein
VVVMVMVMVNTGAAGEGACVPWATAPVNPWNLCYCWASCC